MNEKVDAAEILFARAVLLALEFKIEDAVALIERCRLLCRNDPHARVLAARAIFLKSEVEEDKSLREEARVALEQVQDGQNDLRIELAIATQVQADHLRFECECGRECKCDRPKRADELTALVPEILPAQHRHRDIYDLRQEFHLQRVSRAVETISRAFGPESLEMANALIAQSDQVLGSSIDADQGAVILKGYARALAIYTAVFGSGTTQPDLAVVHGRLGSFHVRLGDTATAVQHYETARAMNEKLFGPKSLEVFSVLNALKRLYAEDREHHRLIVAQLVDNCPVANEVARVAKWWADHFRVAPPVAGGFLKRASAWLSRTARQERNRRALRFQGVLEAQLLRTIEYFPNSIRLDYGPDPVLERALADAGIADLSAIPWKSVSYLEPGKVTVNCGTWLKERVIYNAR